MHIDRALGFAGDFLRWSRIFEKERKKRRERKRKEKEEKEGENYELT